MMRLIMSVTAAFAMQFAVAADAAPTPRPCAPITRAGVPGGLYGIRAIGITCQGARFMLRQQLAEHRNCARGWTCTHGVHVPWAREGRFLSRRGHARVWWNFTDGGHGT